MVMAKGGRELRGECMYGREGRPIDSITLVGRKASEASAAGTIPSTPQSSKVQKNATNRGKHNVLGSQDGCVCVCMRSHV